MRSIMKNAKKVRAVELIVLLAGSLVALIMLGQDAGGAFRANMAGGNQVAGFLTTCFSFLILGIFITSPYHLLAFLGKKIASRGKANRYQIAGLLISFMVTSASIFLYVDAYSVISQSRSSTAGLVILNIPILMVMFGGGLYGCLLFLYSRAQK